MAGAFDLDLAHARQLRHRLAHAPDDLLGERQYGVVSCTSRCT